MDFRWTNDSIRWFADAADQSDFHQKLADAIRPWLFSDDYLTDIGCGLGYLDLHLSPFVGHVTCIDRDPLAISFLQTKFKKTVGISSHRYTIQQGDWRTSCEKRGCDILLMSFFGRIFTSKQLFDYMAMARRGLIYIINTDAGSAFSPSGKSVKQKQYQDGFSAILRRANLSHEVIRLTSEFGQPLSDIADARAFTLHYHPSFSEETTDRYLERNLISVKNGLYLPCTKDITIYFIPVKSELHTDPSKKQ